VASPPFSIKKSKVFLIFIQISVPHQRPAILPASALIIIAGPKGMIILVTEKKEMIQS
jgi:hypothetical protein